MKANELRIGNWYKDSYYFTTYNQITAEEILELKDNPDYNYYNPIEITEEGLLRFGFTLNKIDNYYFIQNSDGYIHSIKYFEKDEFLDEDSGWAYFIDDSDAACHRLCMINYIHELQNLYFAINKTELEVKNV
jgi:hypothetical protein